jgi:hypothetical protein
MFKESLLFLLIAIVSISVGQENADRRVENAQRRVAPALEECYRNRQLFERDNRVPMTINTLIELIRKVEDTPNFNMDIRQLAVALVHRFRQDGNFVETFGCTIVDDNCSLFLQVSVQLLVYSQIKTTFYHSGFF